MTPRVHFVSISGVRGPEVPGAAPCCARVYAGQDGWGGWVSNPRPADYESAALTG